MKYHALVAACIHLLGVSAIEIEPRDSRGSYTVSGLGTRKKAILNAGGNTLDLAIAMLETENMGTDYTYGDGKTLDSANFGVFKQNWGIMRICGSRAGFAGKSQSAWNDGAKLNSDLYADVATRWDCQEYYGYDVWFAGHRNGASGLTNPNTDDIKTYKTAVQWIQSQIDSASKYQTDDTRFWVDVTAI
ncbi:hypothetical protein B0J13DRAFT_595703 [Dactylonectria estremocensis]|uniref:Uncharacterized protein n=1 Tax=Dactylonectria estremocensis TaxID=1079267 RepID=A0A9P9EUC6_9HYPO|nr:hypothetical protein B0J13DRAFT_595703 [Dactylonectria estremocensis]